MAVALELIHAHATQITMAITANTGVLGQLTAVVKGTVTS